MDRNLRIRMLLEAGDRVSKPLRDIAAGSTGAARALKATRDRLKEIEAAQADIGAFRRLKTDMRASEVAMAAAQTKVGQLARAMAETDKPTKKLSAEFARAKREAAGLKDDHAALAQQTQATRDRLAAAGVATGNLVTHERALRTAAAAANDELGRQEQRLKDVDDRGRRFAAARERFGSVQDRAGGLAAGGAAAIGVGVAAAAPVVAASRAAMSLEEGMAGVAKVTGLAGEQLGDMQRRIVALSTKIPMAAVDLSNIAAAAGAAGVGMDKFGRPLPSQAQDLVAFTDAAARMGIAFDMTAEDAGATMAKWRQAFRLPQAEIEALGDRVNALTNRFGGKAADVSDVISRIGPLGEVAGLAAPQIAALGSSLNSIGVENEIAATGIKNTLLALTKGDAATKSQTKAFDALGLSAEGVAKRMQTDASGTIVDVLERIGRLSPDRQASTLSELFGSESIGAIAPLLTNLDGLKTRLALVAKESEFAGSMTGEFLSRINTTTGVTDLAANSLQAVNLSLGQALLPSIKAGAQWVGRIANRMSAWAARNPGYAKAIMYVAAGTAALFMVLGGGAIVLAGLVAPFAALSAAAAFLGVGLLPIAGIALGVVAGMAAVAGAAYLIYSNWASISGFFSGIWGAIAGVFSGGIGGVLTLLVGWGAAALGTLYRWGGDALGWLSGTLPGMLYTGMGLALTGMGRAIVFAFTTLPVMFAKLGWEIVSGLLKGLLGAPARIANAASSLANLVTTKFKAAAGIHSPSRVFMALGGHIVGGLTKGIDGQAREPVRRIALVANRMQQAAGAGVRDLPALSGQILTALSIGTATPAGAAPPAPPPAPAAAPITMNIYQQPGESGEALARRVAAELGRQTNAPRTGRSSYADVGEF